MRNEPMKLIATINNETMKEVVDAYELGEVKSVFDITDRQHQELASLLDSLFYLQWNEDMPFDNNVVLRWNDDNPNTIEVAFYLSSHFEEDYDRDEIADSRDEYTLECFKDTWKNGISSFNEAMNDLLDDIENEVYASAHCRYFYFDDAMNIVIE